MFEVVGAGGRASVGGNDFRLAVGPERLKSTLIKELDVSGGRMTARGTGFGHGVGLSQWDTYKMAKEESRPEEIVAVLF